MLSNRTDEAEAIPPDAPMVGKCWTCGTTMHCLREFCTILYDPTMGSTVCAQCLKPVAGRRQVRNLRGELVEVDAICGARVHMSRQRKEQT